MTGEMGIGNTTTSSAVASVLLGCDPLLVTGRGAGLSDSGLSRKLEAIKKAIKLHHPDPEDPLSVLSMLGGFDIAGMVGLYLGGALYQVPVLIDGVISAVAALLAVKICPASKKAMLATHVSAEPAGCMILDAIGLEPMITAGMRLGEGTGALCAIPMLDMACSVYQGSTFGELSIEAYEERAASCKEAENGKEEGYADIDCGRKREWKERFCGKLRDGSRRKPYLHRNDAADGQR